MEVIVGCNFRSDLWTFRSKEIVARRTEGCRKRSQGTNDLLYIDRAVISQVESRKKSLAMTGIDYKKAYNMVPHSWIKEYFELFGVAENIKTLLVNSMEEWKLTLCAKNSELREVYIKQGIFQGDSLSINCLKIKNDVCSSTS